MNIVKHKPISPKFYPLYDTKQNFRYIIFYGGRASGKSWEMATYIVLMSYMYRTRVACLRAQKCKIQESSFKLIKDTIDRLGLKDCFYITHTTIRSLRTQSEIFFTGLHDPESFKSTEGLTHAWIEEGQQISDEQMDIIIPTLMRNKGAQLLISFNPRHPNDWVSQQYIENTTYPEGTYIVNINYDENPHLSPEISDQIELLKKSDYERYKYVYKGLYQDRSDQCLFSLDDIKAMINRPVDREDGSEYIVRAGLDIAREGNDSSCICIMKGYKMLHLESWQESDTTKTVERVVDICQRFNIRAMYVDTVGLGGPVFDRLNQLNIVEKLLEFKNNNTVVKERRQRNKTKVLCTNWKSDALLYIKENSDKISVLDNKDLLVQMQDCRYDYDLNDKFFIIGKKRMKREFKIASSPDELEAFMMSFYAPMKIVKKVNHRIGNIIIKR